MASDFRIRSNFFEHPKTRRLSRRLGDEGICSLLRLWAFCSSTREDGSLHDLDAEDLAYYARYRGDPNEFMQALIEVGFVDKNSETGTLSIHDWNDEQPWASRAPGRRRASTVAAMIRWHNAGRHTTIHSGCPLCEKATARRDEPCAPHAPRMRDACEPHSETHTDGNAPIPIPTPTPTPIIAASRAALEVVTPSVPEPVTDRYFEVKTPDTRDDDELDLVQLEQEGFARLGPLGGRHVASLQKFLPVRRWEWTAALKLPNARSWGYVLKVLESMRSETSRPAPPPAGDAPTSLDGILAELKRIASGAQREPHSDPVAQAVIVRRGGRRRLGAMDDRAFRLEQARFLDEYRERSTAVCRLAESSSGGMAPGSVGASAAAS